MRNPMELTGRTIVVTGDGYSVAACRIFARNISPQVADTTRGSAPVEQSSDSSDDEYNDDGNDEGDSDDFSSVDGDRRLEVVR